MRARAEIVSKKKFSEMKFAGTYQRIASKAISAVEMCGVWNRW